MMDGAHPDELDLLAFVEEDLSEPQKKAVAEHLAACAACADAAGRLETARYALRSAALLELPEERRQAALAALPERSVRRGWSWRPRLVAPVLAGAAVAAIVVGIVVTGDFDREQAGEAAKAVTTSEGAGQDAGDDAVPEAAPATTDMRALSENAVASVQGPPQEVARLLRRQGFDARVVESAVEVRDAEREEVRRALVGRPAGPVPVFVP